MDCSGYGGLVSAKRALTSRGAGFATSSRNSNVILRVSWPRSVNYVSR
jgi:hypothetical protein